MNRLLSIAVTVDSAIAWLLKAGLGGAIAVIAYWLFELACRPPRRPAR